MFNVDKQEKNYIYTNIVQGRYSCMNVVPGQPHDRQRSVGYLTQISISNAGIYVVDLVLL